MCFLGDTLNRVYDNMELTKKVATCASKDHEGQVQRCNRSASRASNGKSRAHFTVPLTGTVPDCAVAPCRGCQWESIHPHVESHCKTVSRCWCPVIHTEPSVTPLPPRPSSATNQILPPDVVGSCSSKLGILSQ